MSLRPQKGAKERLRAKIANDQAWELPIKAMKAMNSCGRLTASSFPGAYLCKTFSLLVWHKWQGNPPVRLGNARTSQRAFGPGPKIHKTSENQGTPCGWKKEGGGKPHEGHPPKKGFRPPPLVQYVFHLPPGVIALFSYPESQDRADQTFFWLERSRNFS